MSRILYIWELGEGYGHIAGFLPLARALREHGHTVTAALRDLTHADAMLSNEAVAFMQAPIWFPDTHGLPPAVNYAEILFRVGYLASAGLESLVRGWRRLFDLARPDLLIVDHAPTALLAARALNVRRVLFGSGFFSPPRVHPMPSIRPWLGVPDERLVDSERQAVEVINDVLERLHAPPLGVLANLFDVDEDFLCTFPELDHYPGRPGARYWGARFVTTEGVPPRWPPGTGPRIFAYLSSAHPDFERVLQALREGPYRVLVHAPGADPRVLRRYRAASLAFAETPVHMASTTASCDLVICHGGSGTVVATLLAGRPLVLLPRHPDQSLASLSVVRLGAGAMAHEDGERPSYRRMIRELVDDARYTEHARAFARRYASFDQARQLERIAARCAEVLRGSSASPTDPVEPWR